MGLTNENKKQIKVETGYLCLVILFSLVITLFGLILTLKGFTIFLDHLVLVLPMFLLVFTILLVMYIYQAKIIRIKNHRASRIREFLIVFTTILFGVITSCASYSFVSTFILTTVSVSLVIAILLSQRLGILSAISTSLIILLLTVFTKFLAFNEFDIVDTCGAFVSTLAAICATFLVHKGYTRFKITIGTFLIGFAIIPLSIPFSFFAKDNAFDFMLTNALLSFLGNTVAVGLTMVLLPLYERIYRIWTDFKLAEVCSLNQPLLKELKQKAPGTFSHSLTVATLAENCAIALDLNPFMARACAMYHDIGKTKNPQFFIENQEGGYNPHNDLIIDVSVKMITEHPEIGAKMLNDHGLPDTIIKAAMEHHGDSTLMFFYLKAQGLTEGALEADNYRYENPKPSTKYSAIIMICDMCEATIRSKKPNTREEMEEIVSKIIEGRILDGQFSNCELSLKDLTKIKESVCEALPSLFHERIDYEKAKERQ